MGAAVRTAGRSLHFSSSLQAEMTAILSALQQNELDEQTHASIRICTDSLSSVLLLQRGPFDQTNPTAAGIWRLLLKRRARTDLVWVPSHCGLDGNELADQAANAATNLDQSTTQLSLSTAKAVIKQWRRNEDRRLYGGYAAWLSRPVTLKNR